MPGLPADGGVDHREQRRRDVHDPDAAQPGRRDEAREVRRRSPADRDDRVRAREVGLPEHPPAERRDLGRLRVLRVGHLGEDRLVPLRDEVLAHGVGRRRHGLGREDQDLPHALAEERGQLAEQAPSDHHVVGLRRPRRAPSGSRARGSGSPWLLALRPRRCGPRTRAASAIWRATAAAVRPSVSTTRVATCWYTGRRRSMSACHCARGLPSSSGRDWLKPTRGAACASETSRKTTTPPPRDVARRAPPASAGP